MLRILSRNQFLFSQIAKMPLAIQASLKIRNSDRLEMEMIKGDQGTPITFQIGMMGSLKDIAD